MAESVVTTIAEGILKKFGSLALEQISLWWNVKDELKKLEITVSAIQTVLLYADKQPTLSDQVKNYIDNLKDVLYDADDLLDDFYTEALRQQVMSGNKMLKEVCIFFSSSNQFFYGLKMGHEIKAIREKLDDIQRNRGFHIGEGTVVTQVGTSHRETDSVTPLEGVIGREKEKQEIIKRLLGSNFEENGSNLEESVLIIPIVGIGGLGKTTLAQFVYNDDEVKNHFELKLWVCVSDVFDVKTIVKNIIKSATNKKPEDLQLDQLQKDLQEKLNGKKYLLVLDDVWNNNRDKWNHLKKYLMGGARGSRIVLTTRSLEVAKLTSKVPPCTLGGLSETNSWNLFVKMAFTEQQEPTNQNIVDIGKEIVKKCAGVPLAIKTMGRLLYSGQQEDDWKRFNTELSLLTQEEGDILPTLKVSYNNLEPHLKHCFAYCMLFPKDHEIDVKTLIYLWIAQGIVKSSNSSQSLEQIGYEYFKVLLWRSFFQDPEKDEESGYVVSCKMHDLMHDLAVEVAGEESIMLSSDKEIKSAKNKRHVSIDENDGYALSSETLDLFEANKIRTFLLSSGWLSSEEVEFVSKFRRLRMLDLHHSWITTLPESIGELKHLRYLDLSDNYEIEMLPRSIARLQNLVVLKLSDCGDLKELPEQIGKLVSLMILEFDGCRSLTHMPEGLGHLTSLQKLTRFIVSKDDSVSKKCGGLNELNGLINLRGELKLVNLGHVKNAELEYKAANLKSKKHLESLILSWGPDEDEYSDVDTEGSDDEVTRANMSQCFQQCLQQICLFLLPTSTSVNVQTVDAMSMEGLQPHTNLKKLHVSGYPGVTCPSWLSSLTNLVNLEFLGFNKVKYLPPLDGLSSLKYLSIKDLSDVEYIECNCSRATFFSSLEILKISKCLNLKGWRMGSTETELPSFPRLSKLQIEDCQNLTSMPLFPTIEGELKLVNASGKPLEETMMMNSMMSTSSSSSSSPPLPLSELGSLQIGYIEDLENLPDQGMWNLTSLESLEIDSCNMLLSLAGEGFRGLTSLRSLSIDSCERLKSISGVFQHCTALEKLDINNCKELDFSDAMHCQGLRSLTSLTIDCLPQLVSLPEDLQHVTTLQVLHILECKNLKTSPDWIASLTSLQELTITDLPQLVSLPDELQHVTTLQVLHIERCENLKTLPSLTSLQNIHIGYCSEFTSLPEGMHHLTSLQELTITDLPQLVSLPEELQHVTTLQVLHILRCENLKTLPDWIGRLTSLQELSIDECPLLTERCGNNSGVDWPKISRIPNIIIDFKLIQWGGCYLLV